MVRPVAQSAQQRGAHSHVDAVTAVPAVSRLKSLRNSVLPKPRSWHAGTHLAEHPVAVDWDTRHDSLHKIARAPEAEDPALPPLPESVLLPTPELALPALPKSHLPPLPELAQLPFAASPSSLRNQVSAFPETQETPSSVSAADELPPITQAALQPLSLPSLPLESRHLIPSRRFTGAAENALGQVLSVYSSRRLQNLFAACDDPGTRQIIAELLQQRATKAG